MNNLKINPSLFVIAVFLTVWVLCTVHETLGAPLDSSSSLSFEFNLTMENEGFLNKILDESQLAKTLGKGLSKMERGVARPSQHMVPPLAAITGYELSHLVAKGAGKRRMADRLDNFLCVSHYITIYILTSNNPHYLSAAYSKIFNATQRSKCGRQIFFEKTRIIGGKKIVSTYNYT